jgi:SAM-dependent methyltransferase
VTTTSAWEGAVRWLRAQSAQQELVRLCYYDDPLEAAAARFGASPEWQATEALLSSALPTEVLDLGAGRGIASYALARAGCRVVALEPDSSEVVGRGAIAYLAGRTGLPITPVAAFGEDLPFEDNRFGAVYGRAVLHHAANLGQLCREVARVLRPGGLFLAVREHVISRDQDLPAFLRSHPLHARYGGENAFRLDQYLDALRSAGLAMRRIIGPCDSVVNYWPLTPAELCRHWTRRLPRRVQAIAARFLTLPGLWPLAARLQSWRSTAPGRHYAFLGAKP